MATFAEERLADITAAITLFEQTFTWRSTTYACVINGGQRSLLTLKSNFPQGRYPKWGDLITVAGKQRQVTRLNGTALVTESGQMIEDPPFTDDPNDPSLVIEYDILIKQ